ncbi:EAL domain-containing protein [Rhodoferax sp. WC2427]|uniref:bifunctional diguanylate cyclase/phosphodiesterase n=1 Tax=Rhodoferax sp. WC2427 TaxID=3234144 RepID=UPI0034674569
MRSHHHVVVALMGALLVCIWGFIGFWSWWERASMHTSQGLILEQLTAAVQAQTKGLFKQAESTLIAANQWMGDHPNADPGKAPDFIALVEKLRTTSGGLLDVRMVSQSGELRLVPDLDQSRGIQVADRDYFRAQFVPATRGLYIGQPILGRVTKKWFIPISAPVERASGTIAVLLVVIELDRIAESFDAERIQPAGTIGIVRTDGTMLFRSPLDPKTIGQSIAKGEAWKRYMNVLTKGSYESSVSIFDRLPRLVSFARVDDYPLVVYVSASKSDMLQPWVFHTAILGGVAALVSLLSLLAGAALLRAMNTSQVASAIVQSSDDAIIGKSLEGTITSWNPGAERIFGYTALEIVGQPILRLLPPDRVHEEDLILEKIKSGHGIEHFETVRVRKDGSAIHVSVTISPIRDEFGHLIGASKIARDTTEQENTNRQLQLTASVFTNTAEGILITDRAGTILEVNDAFTRITGYSREEVIGNDPRMFRSSRQGPEVFKAIRQSLIRRGEWKGEMWSRRKSGEAYSAWLTVSKVKGSTGQVRNYVALFSDVTVLKLQQEELEHGAHFDALTDLPNRLLLSDRLQQAMNMCQRQGNYLAVVYLDLDGFKAVNDTFGHEMGDALLVAVSRRMHAALREVDTLARMGGDEFVAVLTGMHSIQDCIQMVTRILGVCAEPVRIQNQDLRVTASIGVTMYPQDNAEADQLMRHADQAMYEAKQGGKNRFHMFDSAQDAEFKNRSLQQEQVAQGLRQQEFVLYYQPKVNMRTGAIVGAEALVRWQHPQRGLLPPGVFLPAIEKHPLSDALGLWVLEAALQQMSAWQLQGLSLPVSVNVAARQLQHAGFPSQLADLLAHYPSVDPKCLELEVLETSALEDINSTASILQACHGLGVRFAMDDFGTGYSSLTYLRHLPVETLKIDQSFVRDMLIDQSDLSIVVGVIGLAVAFQRDVIAEGVETVAHGERLMELGCVLAQGYQIARPMPASLVPTWCATWKLPAAWARFTGTASAGKHLVSAPYEE